MRTTFGQKSFQAIEIPGRRAAASNLCPEAWMMIDLHNQHSSGENYDLSNSEPTSDR